MLHAVIDTLSLRVVLQTVTDTLSLDVLCYKLLQTHCHRVTECDVLQAAQQIMELSEAAQINQGLQPTNIGREASLHDMKAIVKTWR